MKRVKGFNFDIKEDRDIISYIEKQHNQSSYIKALVKKDMDKESIEDVVKRQIEKYLGGVEFREKNKSVEIDAMEVMNILQM